MIIREIRGSSADRAYFLSPEDVDDLFALRRVIEVGDHVIADTSRVIKQIKEYSRPDKGERIKVRLSIKINSINLDNVTDRLRIGGIITNTDNELVSKGSHHSLTVQVGDKLTIEKERRWNDFEINILNKARNSASFILTAIDLQEAAVAKITGTHLKIIPNIYSGQSGKQYQQATKKNSLHTKMFFEDIAKVITSVFTAEKGNNSEKIIIFGPGEIKRRFYNFLVTEKKEFEKENFAIIDGIDVAGEDGIFVFLRSPMIKEIMNSSKLAIVSSILDEIMHLVHKGEPKYVMGLQEVSSAASLKSVDCLVFSDSIFETANENDIIKLLNLIESYGGKTFAVDSSTDIGLRVSSLGGIVALLRYAVHL